MSFSVSKSGKPHEVESQLELAGEQAKPGRNGIEQRAIDLGVALGIAAMKHVSIDQHKTAGVSIAGHIGEDGTGSWQVSVNVAHAVAATDSPARVGGITKTPTVDTAALDRLADDGGQA